MSCAYEENVDYLRRYRLPGGGRELHWRASNEPGLEFPFYVGWGMHEEVSRANEQLTEARPPDLVQAFRSEIDGVDPSELAGILQKLLTAVYKNSECYILQARPTRKVHPPIPGSLS